ncbi:hypothetical protein [Clostridium estertheticum]|uniref:hypothetical protein n=1 Tax=Clostridium estertheticum TaxID=238834 RepID=UPI00124D88E8|nr:hypothetical protein [Clostridium estertheticum]MBZ9615321.1 hypothetical protein [Clostridium estertheticum subsp. laramiense]WAG75210.1 hypothetical protein LL032_07095 [Clostridium estertheticum]
MELEKLEEQLKLLTDKMIKKFTTDIPKENQSVKDTIESQVLDTIVILSSRIAAEMIYEYEKLKIKND